MQSKTILITGISRGIGKHLAIAFSKAGWNVCGCYKNDKPDYVLKNSKFIQADVCVYDDVKKLVTTTIGEYGSIDSLINNAGISNPSTILKMSNNEWSSVINTNLTGVFYTTKEVLKVLSKRRKSGSIINIVSIRAFTAFIGSANYSTSKAGLIAFTKNLSIEAGHFGITANAVLPGFHLTNMGNNASDSYIKKVKEESVLNTTTDIKEFTDFIIFLSGLKTVSGQVFNFDSRLI
ncbi:MAG: SDR family oxidoreductase [Endomicrobium sp.]|jgi:3-oxoacyl-[acyl-carrier protein] reductase|nr:SDR family oxidoreductase [Endomicrobium sp.]